MNKVPATSTGLSLRGRVGAWIDSAAVQRFVIGLILLNAITLGLETSPAVMAKIGESLLVVDGIILGVFVAELTLKLYARGWGFFRDPWNLFDFLIVTIALVPASGPLAVLRALRVLRVLRLVSTVPQLRFVVEALLHAIPGITSIAALMVVLFYVFAVMATGLFGSHHPEWFGSIGRSMYTLFQIMTLESWSMGIARPVMETHPHAWLFFVPFILIATFTILNLFIAIIVNTMQTMHEAAQEKEATRIAQAANVANDSFGSELAAMRQELQRLRRLIERDER